MALTYTYVAGTNSYTVSGNDGTDVNLIIPDTYTGPQGTLPVLIVGATAFLNATNLISVVIGNNTTNIQTRAFEGCANLTTVTIPNSVNRLAGSIFKNCTSLNNVTIPNSVNNLGTNIFNGCTSLTNITITNNVAVTNITSSMFEGCTSLTTITIPNNIFTIGQKAFYGCINLSSISIPNSVTTIGTQTFELCTSLTNITLPNSLWTINVGAFSGSSITSIEIPDSVSLIGASAFFGCENLATVKLPSNLTIIYNNTFQGCVNLTSINLSDKITEIYYNAFDGCTSLTEISIPKNLTLLDDGAFENCTNLKDIYFLGNFPTTVGVNIFQNVSPNAIIYYYDTKINGIDLNLPTQVINEFGNQKLASFGIKNKSKGYISFGKTLNAGSMSFDKSNLLLNLSSYGVGSENYGINGVWPNLASPSNNADVFSEPSFHTVGNAKYYHFNGIDQFVVYDKKAVPQNSYTKCVWFRINTFNGYANNLVSSLDGGHFMYFAGSNKMYCGHSDWGDYQAYQSAKTFNENIWYFAVLTFNTIDGMKLYIDGVLDSTYTANKNPHPGNGSTLIGSYDGGNLLNGDVSIVRTYNTALSEAEILNIYNDTKDYFQIYKVAIFGAGNSEFNGEYIWDGTTLVNGKPTYIGPSPYGGNNAYIYWDSDNNIWNLNLDVETLLYQSVDLLTWTRPSGGGDDPAPSSVLSYNQNSFITSITFDYADNFRANGTFARASSQDSFSGQTGNTSDSGIILDNGDGNFWAYMYENANGTVMYRTPNFPSSSLVSLFNWNPQQESSAPTPQVVGLAYSE